MKLIPKAKAVRMRIMSGGKEHTTLKSLQNDFVWKDVEGLLDGRLIKWLKRINEIDIANRLSNLPNPHEDILGVYNILFRGTNPFHDSKEVFAAADSNIIKPLAIELLNTLTIPELIILIKRFPTFKVHAIGKLAYLSELNIEKLSEKDSFSIGQLLYNEHNYREQGEKLIQSAAERGNKDTIEFYQNIFKKSPVKVTRQAVRECWRDSDLQLLLENSWASNESIILNGSPAQNVIYDFYNTCLKLYRKREIDIFKLDSFVKNLFGDIDENDPLEQEKIFVRALFLGDLDDAKSSLLTVSHYLPARRVYESSYDSYGKGLFFITYNNRMYGLRLGVYSQNMVALEAILLKMIPYYILYY